MKAFFTRFGLFALLAAVAYVLTLAFVYPRFFAPFVPFHADEYQGVDLAAQALNAASFIGWPRPMAFLTFFLAGHLGLTGSLVFYAALTMADLALAMALFERYFLRARVPWWIAFASFVLAIAGPGFYFSVGYDLEFSLAAFFGLLGIFAWESRSEKKIPQALSLCAACFLLSVLSKESFVPALFVYGIAAAFFRGPLPTAVKAALVLLPFAVAAVAFADDRLVGSPFVNLTGASSNSYYVSLAPSSLMASAAFYLTPLINLPFLAFLAACGVGAWQHKRLALGIGILLGAFLLYTPYFALPNHWDVCYWWVAMPVLMLLVPLAWVSSGEDNRTVLWSRAAVALTLVGAVAFFAFQNANSELEQFLLSQQKINGNMLAALRGVQGEIQRSHRILVTGITYQFHPWMNGDFLAPDLGYEGTWTVATDPTSGPVPVQHSVAPIAYKAIRWKDYDLVLVFGDGGGLAGIYQPDELVAAIRRQRLTGASNIVVVSALRNAPVRSADSGNGNGVTGFYPKGILPFPNQVSAVAHGLYPEDTSQACCFLAQTARLRLAKPIGARVATFTFYVPHFPPFVSAPERITMAFDGIPAGEAELRIGVRDASFTFPPQLVGKSNVEAVMTMSIAYVPKEIGINGDPRRLSVILKEVDYK